MITRRLTLAFLLMAGLPIQVPTFRARRRGRRWRKSLRWTESNGAIVFSCPARSAPAPLVLVFHGGGGNSAQMERYSRFDGPAEREGFIVAYPESIGGNWNDGRGAQSIPRSERTLMT